MFKRPLAGVVLVVLAGLILLPVVDIDNGQIGAVDADVPTTIADGGKPMPPLPPGDDEQRVAGRNVQV